jgi:3-phenylpropionate/cinnamic acid dioxygenase small subunit
MEVDASPLRDESSMILAFRVQRAYKSNAWGSNPPARTRRNISNIMISLSSEANSREELRVQSNFILYYSRHRDDNHIYSGQRIDTLIQDADTFKIAKREIRLDWNLIPVPTVGLFF